MLARYSAEKPRDRAKASADEIPAALATVKRNCAQLYQWQDEALQAFPSPIGLDEEHSAVTIFANMMFFYFE